MVDGVVHSAPCPQGRAHGGSRNPTFGAVREANDTDDIVRSRLRSVLAGPVTRPGPGSSGAPGGLGGGPGAPGGSGVPGRSAGGSVPPGWPTGDDGPLAWSDLVPSWPDDVDLDDAGAPRPVTPRYAWEFQDSEPGEDGSDPGGDEEVRRVGLSTFDPGRRGVKALAAVAVLVVLIAAFFAWRARPRVDPVPPVPAGVSAGSGGAGGAPTAKASTSAEVVIAVAGKVKKPGLVRLPGGSRVADALQAAGGAEPGVDVAMLNLARKVVDGELILVGVTAPPGAPVATGAAGAPGGGAPAGGPVNLNTATLADLDTLPGVGPVLAQRILDAREAQGGFKSVADLRKVDGIGDSRYEQLKDLVTV